jgi:hypothetical protein
MDLAQFAPDRVLVDILMKLSVYNEDWVRTGFGECRT